MRPQRIDLGAGLLVAAIGAAALVESLRMPRFEARGADPYTVPGLTPGLIAAAMLLLGLGLVVRGIRGTGPGTGVTLGDWDRPALIRTALTLGLTLTYGLLLFGNIPFRIATALFVFAFTLCLDWNSPQRRLSRPMLAVFAAIFATAAAFGIDFIFREIFLVRLPG